MLSLLVCAFEIYVDMPVKSSIREFHFPSVGIFSLLYLENNTRKTS